MLQLTPEQIIKLINLGFKVTGGIKDLIKSYQQYHGLEASGELDSTTLRSIEEAHRFCSHPDVMPEQIGNNGSCRWPNKDVAWTIVQGLPNVPNEILKQAYTLAWSYISEVCGLTPFFVSEANKAQVIMGSRGIDNAGGVLAESELPCGNVKVCRQWYDTGENWVISENPTQGQIDLVRVACHELIHALGVNHGPAGNLMAPVYSPMIRKPRSWDIEQLQARYGPPNPINPPPGPGIINITIDGTNITIPGYRVTKLS